MIIPTRDIQVVVLTEFWNKGYTREDGTVVEPGWMKPKGWPARASQRADGDINEFSRGAMKAYHECSMYQALTHHATSPAYFVGYKPTNIGLRIRKDALNPLFSGFTEDAGGIHMHLALFDVDNHDAGCDIEQWYTYEECPKIEALIDTHPGVIVYRSRRGYRIVAVLREPIALKNQADSNRWDRLYTAWCNYLSRKFDIKADVLLDWTRFQAVPHTCKEKGQPALDLEIIGDPNFIGVWDPQLEDSDWPAEKKSVLSEIAFEGEAQLLKLIRISGLRCDPTESALAWDICCPNWMSHSPDSRGLKDYPTKTVLYVNGPIGAIECKSSGCRAAHPNPSKDYLRHFKDEDVRRTRPKGHVDVYDPKVLPLVVARNLMCNTVDIENWSERPDTGYSSYREALKNQRRLGEE